MGYFWRGIDRGRSRAEKLAVQRLPCRELPWSAVTTKPPRKRCWVRFSTLVLFESSGRREGLFMAVGRLEDDPDTDPVAFAAVRSATDWFDEHLRVPRMDEPRAVWFFKTTARECMARAWELIHALREAGVVVEMQIVPEGSGSVVYEDEHQVALVPDRDSGVR